MNDIEWEVGMRNGLKWMDGNWTRWADGRAWARERNWEFFAVSFHPIYLPSFDMRSSYWMMSSLLWAAPTASSLPPFLYCINYGVESIYIYIWILSLSHSHRGYLYMKMLYKNTQLDSIGNKGRKKRNWNSDNVFDLCQCSGMIQFLLIVSCECWRGAEWWRR